MAVAAQINTQATTVSRWRVFSAGAIVFVLANVGAIVVHGFVLASDSAPFYGTLLRGGGPATWQFIFLPVVHLSFTVGLIWLFRVARANDERWTAHALKLGVIAYLIGPGPLFLLWYAQQPWPRALAVKQLGYELVIALLLALSAGALLRKVDTRRIGV